MTLEEETAGGSRGEQHDHGDEHDGQAPVRDRVPKHALAEPAAVFQGESYVRFKRSPSPEADAQAG